MTNAAKVVYVGHSQGTTQAFAALSKPTKGLFAGRSQIMQEMQDSISVYVALAPVAYVGNTQSRLLQLLAAGRLPELVDALPFGYGEFLTGELMNNIAPEICEGNPELCLNVVAGLTGPNYMINETQVPVYVSATPAGSSYQTMEHWAQSVRKDKFKMFDQCYAAIPGSTCRQNNQFYGESTPPDYNLSAVAVPMALYSGGMDWLTAAPDLERTIGQLNPAFIVRNVKSDMYAHMDFTWGIDTEGGGALPIYNGILDVIGEYARAI